MNWEIIKIEVVYLNATKRSIEKLLPDVVVNGNYYINVNPIK
jgi:hypothetical protein